MKDSKQMLCLQLLLSHCLIHLNPWKGFVPVGASEKPIEVASFSFIMGRRIDVGSNIGGLKETREMLDFAAKHGMTAYIEVIRIDYSNTDMYWLLKSVVRYGFVIDTNSIKAYMVCYLLRFGLTFFSSLY